MNKYFIPEIDLKRIRNNPEILNKLINKYTVETINEQLILTTDGFYKIQKDTLIKYKIIHKESNIQENFINNLTLIGTNIFHKKIGEVYNIPYENSIISLEILKFSIEKGKNFLVLEKKDNKIIDLYFLSKKKINEKDTFFKKDVSSFIETINV